MSRVLLIVVNDAGFFLSHRLPVAESARKEGFLVHVATQEGCAVERLVALGFSHHALPLSRSGKSPLGELKALLAIWKLCWRLRPDVLHLVTIKPVLYGGIAARLSPVKGVLAAISGLGFIFMAEGRKAALLRSLVAFLYRVALGKRNLRAVFQNPDDQRALTELGAITEQKSVRIRGSGVDLSQYQYLPEAPGIPVVTLAARLLRDKGVLEFVEAARLLTERGIQARFQLVGDPDPGNPTSIQEGDLAHWQEQGIVHCLGYQSDIASVFAQSHIVVLPSYREGLPKVLVEAAACGRAVVTTDVPGCRDAIEADVTGLLVPVRDSERLAEAIERLLNDKGLRQQMGAAGRALAERAFAIESIVEQHLEIYRTLEKNA
ncbi:glycosyltransferase family 4 protein [Pseudomonas sp. RW10S2]|uniref:glycosyltransferase family 4 protein n=1 Tax=Pseudomonas sp. RW10S2 TaxID=459637 RepID=UPI001644955B|nr:glycosyltransferase family 4 protein [Pseudomonas sp. RW10S2]MBC3465581.1 glycosyltransferase family 4 protein [Pseudomonas sp. RW10S2]QXI44659.1 glycosyltransferase family 4 protein [Pseudomonas wayambapalatensis]